MADTILDEELAPVFQGGLMNEAGHPGNFAFEGAWGENPALKRLNSVVGNGFERTNALHDMRVNRNPADNPAVHASKLKRLVEESFRSFAGEFQDAKDALKRERSKVEADLTAAAGLKVNPDYRSAVVGVFSGLKPEERMAEIERALMEGDGSTLATLLEAPALVTGLTPEQKAGIKSRAFERANPNGHALLKQLEKCAARAENASIAFINAQLALLKGTDRFDRKVEAAKALEAKLAPTVH